jgi:hypothetical protein
MSSDHTPFIPLAEETNDFSGEFDKRSVVSKQLHHTLGGVLAKKTPMVQFRLSGEQGAARKELPFIGR